jgi:hypothetical protein
MSDGRNSEKQEAKQEQPESSSSVWSDVARDVVLGAVLGTPGIVASKLIEEKDKSAAEVAQDLGRAAAEAALTLVTLGAGGAAIRGAVKGATAAMKAGEGSGDKADGKQEQSTADRLFNFYKEVHSDMMPWFLLGPVALVPQVRDSIKSADGLVLDKIRSVSEDLFGSAKKNPLRFAAMSIASPLLPVLDAIVNKEEKEK